MPFRLCQIPAIATSAMHLLGAVSLLRILPLLGSYAVIALVHGATLSALASAAEDEDTITSSEQPAGVAIAPEMEMANSGDLDDNHSLSPDGWGSDSAAPVSRSESSSDTATGVFNENEPLPAADLDAQPELQHSPTGGPETEPDWKSAEFPFERYYREQALAGSDVFTTNGPQSPEAAEESLMVIVDLPEYEVRAPQLAYPEITRKLLEDQLALLNEEARREALVKKHLDVWDRKVFNRWTLPIFGIPGAVRASLLEEAERMKNDVEYNERFMNILRDYNAPVSQTMQQQLWETLTTRQGYRSSF